jgi:hypothetical protein
MMVKNRKQAEERHTGNTGDVVLLLGIIDEHTQLHIRFYCRIAALCKMLGQNIELKFQSLKDI